MSDQLLPASLDGLHHYLQERNLDRAPEPSMRLKGRALQDLMPTLMKWVDSERHIAQHTAHYSHEDLTIDLGSVLGLLCTTTAILIAKSQAHATINTMVLKGVINQVLQEAIEDDCKKSRELTEIAKDVEQSFKRTFQRGSPNVPSTAQGDDAELRSTTSCDPKGTGEGPSRS